jgi:hypothetical protein
VLVAQQVTAMPRTRREEEEKCLPDSLFVFKYFLNQPRSSELDNIHFSEFYFVSEKLMSSSLLNFSEKPEENMEISGHLT